MQLYVILLLSVKSDLIAQNRLANNRHILQMKEQHIHSHPTVDVSCGLGLALLAQRSGSIEFSFIILKICRRSLTVRDKTVSKRGLHWIAHHTSRFPDSIDLTR